MTASQSSRLEGARKREHQMMSFLADFVCDLKMLSDLDHYTDLRQLGYSASLARGAVKGANGKLDMLVSFCQENMGPTSARMDFRDKIQERWAAPWHMDAVKLRKELPLHVMRRMRSSANNLPTH